MYKKLFISKYLAMGILLAVSSVLPMAAQTTTVSTHSNSAIALSSVHIGNFGRINDNYYRGAQPHGSDYRDLSALGVKTVINLTNSDSQANERAMVEQAG